MPHSPEFSPGQRWLSNAESELGLGIVMSTQGRTVEVLFPATDESRIYTQKDAPLTRLILAEGDSAKTAEGWQFGILSVTEESEIVIYSGIREDDKSDVLVPETQLDHNLQMNKPEERLFNLQIDHPKWFDLRLSALDYQYRHAMSPIKGLVGARVSLIPHQLYIASEVANRYAPRVLLADEVGLGKTIEAALIIHQQLITGRAKRVLIAVPDSLVHQWLVEMLRKVNLAFSIFDESRMQAMVSDDDEDANDDSSKASSLGQNGTANPFEEEQLVLCSTRFLTKSQKRLQACAEAGWDLLVVDEAHHLAWSQDAPSQEYLAVETLAKQSTGVLLLTATPDQLGHESHFARLRLLDPDRFHSYEAFLAEEQKYAALAKAVTPLFDETELTEQQIKALVELAPELINEQTQLQTKDEKQALVKQLIDCHGTGRLLFRNRRANIDGFVQRKLHRHMLKLNENISPAITSLEDSSEALLCKTEWLISLLGELKPNKVLLICKKASTAIQVSEQLRLKTGIRHTVFHEGLSIVERDKSAHYFAQTEEGAQLMLCSEIGSEGRNFQFAHHLVLFDLPLTPDLLEQRIGRLDRVGQTKDIQIHVPYIDGSAESALLEWYAQGLNAFEQTCPTGRTVFERYESELMAVLHSPNDEGLRADLIEKTRRHNSELLAQLEQGRDKLLEQSASGYDVVDPIIDDIVEQDTSGELMRFMARLLDGLGVQQEEKDADTFLLTPTESMVNHLPGLDPEGMTVTYRRSIATSLEHTHFLTWDHPLVFNAIDSVLLDVLGKSSMGFIADKSLPKGAYWLQTVFTLQASGPAHLQIDRFLPPTPICIILDSSGKPSDVEFTVTRKVGHKIAKQLVGALQTPIQQHIESARKIAQHNADKLLHGALLIMHDELGGEVSRLTALKQINPSVRDSEIAFFSQQEAQLDHVLKHAEVQLDALRIVINNP